MSELISKRSPPLAVAGILISPQRDQHGPSQSERLSVIIALYTRAVKEANK